MYETWSQHCPSCWTASLSFDCSNPTLQVTEEERICYVPWDFHAFAKERGGHILADLQPVIQQCLDSTGLYTSCGELQVFLPASTHPPHLAPLLGGWQE